MNPKTEPESFVYCGWPLQMLREFCTNTGQRPVAQGYGPACPNPKRCGRCGQPVEFLRHGQELVVLNVVPNECGELVADLIGSHECSK